MSQRVQLPHSQEAQGRAELPTLGTSPGPPPALQRLQGQLQGPKLRVSVLLVAAPLGLLLLGLLSYAYAPHFKAHTHRLFLHGNNLTQVHLMTGT